MYLCMYVYYEIIVIFMVIPSCHHGYGFVVLSRKNTGTKKMDSVSKRSSHFFLSSHRGWLPHRTDLIAAR